MTDEYQSARRRAEAMYRAGALAPPREELPPERIPRMCHACGTRLDPVLVELGETLHPCCEPPKRQRVRRRK